MSKYKNDYSRIECHHNNMPVHAAMLNFSEFFGYPMSSQPTTLPDQLKIPQSEIQKKFFALNDLGTCAPSTGKWSETNFQQLHYAAIWFSFGIVSGREFPLPIKNPLQVLSDS